MKVNVIRLGEGKGLLELEAETPCDKEAIVAIISADHKGVSYIQQQIGDSSIRVKICSY
jgi:hypothetical protein